MTLIYAVLIFSCSLYIKHMLWKCLSNSYQCFLLFGRKGFVSLFNERNVSFVSYLIRIVTLRSMIVNAIVKAEWILYKSS